MSTSTPPHVLVSGGGIAGNALALQLVRSGIRVTVAERAPAPRPGGQSVDLRGASREVAERMGLMPGIRRRQLDERGIAYVNGRGRVYGRMSMEDFDGKGAVAEIEIARGDLNQVLLDELDAASVAAPGLVDLRYGEHLTALEQDAEGVDATFASGRVERFDLVVGADGVHSKTRRLAFGPEEDFATYLGGYTAFFSMPTPADAQPGWFALRAVPGAAIGIRPGADPATSMAILTLRVDRDPSLRGDRAAQEALIRRAVRGSGWHEEAILEAMGSAEDFYFDELDRIDVPEPVSGRIALLGDAASCGSPLSGMGTATALIGAYLLAGEIAATPADPSGALQRYASALAPFAEAGKVLPGGGIGFMVPASRAVALLSQATMRVMLSRPFRPLIKRMFNEESATLALPEIRALANTTAS
ncbi:FAD-binding monooxygenase [Agromyces sp. CFH 90414]|uniref:FAD-binding monooxygenase n=1 Tax=Agromyces agglutinans TaxID=2662258 RepID=A0A6I2FCY5_9MICO|nr:FAD-dependent monooxygenase [Agromyces agglutinans]MRG59803.1 FAD-binding monooxygenase [Agromyces agglutinans]